MKISLCPLLGSPCNKDCINHYLYEPPVVEVEQRFCSYFQKFVDVDFK